MGAVEVFEKQSRLALIHRMVDPLLRRCQRLLEFNKVMQDRSFSAQHDLGGQTVPVEQIVGTVGRGSDFDRAFRPRRKNMVERWVSIQSLFDRDYIFPAIELYKVGDSYFVRDGHHRVSVARANGVLYVDANVIEIEVDGPLPGCG